MKFRPYVDGDFANLSPRLGEQHRSIDVEHLLTVSLGWTVEHEGEVLCVMGLVIPWEGVGEIWALVADEARGHGRPFVRGTKILIEGYMRERDMRRVDCHVPMENYEYRQFVELLGFVPEYVKEQAAPNGGDLIGYVKWGEKACSKAEAHRRQQLTTANSGKTTGHGSSTPAKRGNGI